MYRGRMWNATRNLAILKFHTGCAKGIREGGRGDVARAIEDVDESKGGSDRQCAGIFGRTRGRGRGMERGEGKVMARCKASDFSLVYGTRICKRAFQSFL